VTHPASQTPILLGAHWDHNIVCVEGTFIAVPQALGPRDLTDPENRLHPWIVTGDTENAVIEAIDVNPYRPEWNPAATDVALTELGPPEVIEIEPIHTCNFRCIMCHVSYEKLTKQRLSLSFLDNMDNVRGKWVKLGSLYEPAAHPQFAEIVNGLSDRGARIDLVTNGSLFTDALIERIKDANFKSITVSFDGIRAETFEKIRRRANFERTLDRVKALKAAVLAVNPMCLFQINCTVMSSTLGEVPDAVGFWNKLGFDHLGFIAMVDRDDTDLVKAESLGAHVTELRTVLDEAAQRVIEDRTRISISSAHFRQSLLRTSYPDNFLENAGVVISDHPESRPPLSVTTYFQNGDYPRMNVACRSPFKVVRIWFDGKVNLCHNFPVGDIYSDRLSDIWDGKQAEGIRDTVRANADVCLTCEYYRLCIRSNELDYDEQQSLISQARTTRVGIYVIRRWSGRYFLSPITLKLNALDLADETRWPRLGMVAADSMEKAKKLSLRPKNLAGAIGSLIRHATPRRLSELYSLYLTDRRDPPDKD
jgi:radical SAM protein with 4Fe4S-binding SPASM domain